MQLIFTVYRPTTCYCNVKSKAEADVLLAKLRDKKFDDIDFTKISTAEEGDNPIWETPDGAYLLDDNDKMLHNYSQERS